MLLLTISFINVILHVDIVIIFFEKILTFICFLPKRLCIRYVILYTHRRLVLRKYDIYKLNYKNILYNLENGLDESASITII